MLKQHQVSIINRKSVILFWCIPHYFSYRPISSMASSKLESSTVSSNGGGLQNTSGVFIGDLNNTSAMRTVTAPKRDPAFMYQSLAIKENDDIDAVRSQYRPFIISNDIQMTDWISKLELATVTQMADQNLQLTEHRIRVLVLYGSLRTR
jgi:hypothetical protein